MSDTIKFEKYECREIAIFICKDSGWQLSKEFGFHKSSPARDYFVKWVDCDGKWSLFITDYNSRSNLNYTLNNCIVTVDTLFDVFDYICKNKHIHY